MMGMISTETTVNTIVDGAKRLEEIIQTKNNTIEELRNQIQQLKDEAYKDKELSRLREANSKLAENLRLGFAISKDESEKIEEWKKKHLAEKHEAATCDERLRFGGAVGGAFNYVFIPTSIGIIGYIKCGTCGEKFYFREL